MSTIPIVDQKIEGRSDPTAVTSTGRRLGFLDVLRGLAALAVCMQHLGEESFRSFKSFSQDWINLGAFGVVIFFLISGFIIPASIEKHASLLHFWRGRLFRLYPMYLVVLLIVLVCMHFGLIGMPSLAGWHFVVYVGTNLMMAEDYFGIVRIIGVGWTLGLEMVFYVGCSIAFACGWLRSPVRLAGVAIAVVGLASTAGILAHRSLPMGRLGLLASCFFGTLVYRVYKRETPTIALWLIVPLWLFLLEGFWLRFHLYPSLDAQGTEANFTMTSVVISWAAAYVVFFLFYALRALDFPAVLEWFGKISYSFYLLADIVLLLLPRSHSSWVWIAECLVATTILAALTYRWIERPAMMLASPVRRKLVSA